MESEILEIRKLLTSEQNLSDPELEKIGGRIQNLYRKYKDPKALILIFGLITLFFTALHKFKTPAKTEVKTPTKTEVKKESKYEKPIEETNIVIPEPIEKVGTGLLQVAGYLDNEENMTGEYKKLPETDQYFESKTYKIKKYTFWSLTGIQYSDEILDYKVYNEKPEEIKGIIYQNDSFEIFKTDFLKKNADFLNKLKRISTDFNYDFQTPETGEFIFATGITDYDDKLMKIVEYIKSVNIFDEFFPKKNPEVGLNTKKFTKIAHLQNTSEIFISNNVQSGNDRGNVQSSSVFRVKIGSENNPEIILKIFPAAHLANPNAHFTNSAEFIYQCLLNERNIEYRFYGGGKLMIGDQLCTFLLMKDIGLTDVIKLETFIIKPISLLGDISMSHSLLASAGWLHGDAHSGNIFLTEKTGLTIDFGNMFEIKKSETALKLATDFNEKIIEMIVFMNILDPISSGIHNYITTFNELSIDPYTYEGYHRYDEDITRDIKNPYNALKICIERMANARYIYNKMEDYTEDYIEGLERNIIERFGEIYNFIHDKLLKEKFKFFVRNERFGKSVEMYPDKRQNTILPPLLKLYFQYLKQILELWKLRKTNDYLVLKKIPEIYLNFTYELGKIYSNLQTTNTLKNLVYGFEEIMEESIKKLGYQYGNCSTEVKNQYITFLKEEISKLENPLGIEINIEIDDKNYKFPIEYKSRYSGFIYENFIPFYKKIFYELYVFNQPEIIKEFEKNFTYENFLKKQLYKYNNRENKIREGKFNELKNEIKGPQYYKLFENKDTDKIIFYLCNVDEKLKKYDIIDPNIRTENHQIGIRHIIEMIQMSDVKTELFEKYEKIYNEKFLPEILKYSNKLDIYEDVSREPRYYKLEFDLIKAENDDSKKFHESLWNEFVKEKLPDKDVFEKVTKKYNMKQPFNMVAGFDGYVYFIAVIIIILIILILLLNFSNQKMNYILYYKKCQPVV